MNDSNLNSASRNLASMPGRFVTLLRCVGLNSTKPNSGVHLNFGAVGDGYLVNASKYHNVSTVIQANGGSPW
ncbi:MAG: hypothetical protein K9J74_03520 [Sulfuritalea sp.]|nr:hypothetical protein [Sulfuritalea sp.]